MFQTWRFKTCEYSNIHNHLGVQSSAVANGLVYFGRRDSILYALDTENDIYALSHG